MHYYPQDSSSANLKKLISQNCCSVCGREVRAFMDEEKKVYIACSGGIHEGIAREYQPPVEDYRSNIRRLAELEQTAGTAVTKEIAKLPTHGQLTQTQAMHVLKLVYPHAPADEIVRCAILCRDFGLHPLMREVYLIPFKNKKTGKEEYATVLGINATRKLMARRGTYSYFDDTPRLMTEEEQERIFGAVDTKNIVAITKLRTKDGLEAPGYGRIGKTDTIRGEEKGNTRINMAFIRSERNAFGRLSPDALPQGVEIIDEAYVEGVGEVDKKTGEIKEQAEEKPVEAEFREVAEEEETELPPELEPKPEPEPEGEKDETPVTASQVKQLKELMSSAGKDLAALGQYCNAKKLWKIRDLKNLKKWQFDELCKAFEEGII